MIPLNVTSDTPLIIFSSCDTHYLKYAISLIKSIDVFSPGSNFILHIINPDSAVEERIKNLVSSLQATQLAVLFEHIDLSILNEKQKLAYYASARFPQLAMLLTKYQCPIFSLDADSLVVNSIDFNFSDKLDAEIVLIRRDLEGDVAEHLAVATGSIWLKPSKNTHEFMRDVASKIDEELKKGTLQWFVDQVIFYRQMQAMRTAVKVYNLKRKYADWEFHESSIVWAGKGGRKDQDIRFFLLQALFSDNVARNKFATELKLYISNSKSDVNYSKWLHEKLNVAFGMVKISNRANNGVATTTIRKTRKNDSWVDLYIPRLDLPWKQGSGSKVTTPLLNDDVLELRLYWKKFTIRLANAIERAGMSVNIIELPAWEIDRKTVEASGARFALIPHRCYLDFDEGSTPIMFYMQEYFRSVFVLDQKGWSAASSIYPVDMDTLPKATNESFDIYQKRLQTGELESKFFQVMRQSCTELVASGDIPFTKSCLGSNKKESYIFFPLQIPHDQSIRYFSNIEEMTVVEALISWAKTNNVSVVMKPHPANPKSMLPFKKFIDDNDVFWSEAHVYDLISYSTAVYTINSGVGFETLLHCKPIVTFGRAEYDAVAFHGNVKNFDEAWEYCRATEPQQLQSSYRQFTDWFLGDYAVDISQPKQAVSRLDALAKNIVSRAKKSI